MQYKGKVGKGNTRLLVETVLVIVLTIGLGVIFEELKSIIYALPAVYLLIERRLRHRSWADTGFRIKNTWRDVKTNWYWVLLVGAASPLLTFFAAKYFMPDYIDHVLSRLPMDLNVIIPAVVTAAVGTFLEEIIFRGYIQERLGWFIGSGYAIIIASLLFAFMHLTSGSFYIVAFDMAGIFIDGVLFGIIYLRTRNVFASWIGHFLSDIVGILCILFFI